MQGVWSGICGRGDARIDMTEREHSGDPALIRAYDLAQTAYFTLGQEMEQGDLSHYQDYLKLSARLYTYSTLNKTLVYFQCPQACALAGYRKWQESGYQVRAAEVLKPILIIVPVRDFGRVQDDEGQNRSYPQTVGFKAVQVYDASQLDQVPQLERVHLPARLSQKLNLIRQALGYGLSLFPSTEKEDLTVLGKMLDLWVRNLQQQYYDKFIPTHPEMRYTPSMVKEFQVESAKFIVYSYLNLDYTFARPFRLYTGNNPSGLRSQLERIQLFSQDIIHKIEALAQKQN